MANSVRVLTIVAALVTTLGAADSTPGAFSVAVLRRDGVLIPFAVFNGKRWGHSWPEPRLDLTVPITLQNVPKGWWGPTPPLDSWQAWTGAAPQPLRVVQPDWVDVHCVRQIGLRTDYRPDRPVPPSTEQPYPKDGLAIAPPQRLERIDVLPPEATDVRSLLSPVHEAFNRAERRVADHPIKRRSREGIEPTLEAVYAYGTSPRVFYVESVRMYRPIGGTECEAAAFGTGWFVRDSGGVRPLAMTVDVMRCDRYRASYMLPFGVLRLDNRLFWVAQFSGWDHERYVVVEIKAKSAEAVVSVWGGGC